MSDLPLVHWDASGPYAAFFSTRIGGVSEPPFDTLNLGRLTGDDPAHVEENRARLCGQAGVDPAGIAFNRQQHGADVREATLAVNGAPGDGLWSDVAGCALLVFTADCLPVVLARMGGERPAVAVLHVGWRGLLAGIVEQAAAALGGGRLAAALGPGIGPCCYEVGPDVAEPFQARFGPEIVRNGRLDLWAATELCLAGGGAAVIERVDLCTACHPGLFFSHRRDGGRTGRQGALAYVA